MVMDWPGTGNCWARTETGKSKRATSLSMPSSVNRLVVKLATGHRHDPFPGVFLDVRGPPQVDRGTLLEHRANAGLVLQDADILQRIAVHHQHVGVLARLERAD